MNANVVEVDRTSAAATNSKFVFRFSDTQAGIRSVDNEAGDALVAFRRVDIRKHLKIIWDAQLQYFRN